MKLKYCIILFFTAVLSTFYAQNAESFNYQFVIRDISGKIITNTSLNITFQIAQQKTNNVIWTEEFYNLMSNENGLISVSLSPTIDWQKGPYFLIRSYNFNDQNIVIPAEEIVSVPLAIYARGPKGGDGEKGIKGLAGINGKDGQKGIKGVQGIKGGTGPKGDKGQNGGVFR